MTSIHIDKETLRPLITEVVQQTLAQCHHITDEGEPRLSWREDEAARLLGMAQHQLRDRRLEGEIKGKKIGRSYFYTRDALLALFERKAGE